LETDLGKRLPGPGPFGEAWELSDLSHGRSGIGNGPHAGELFGEAVHRWPGPMCGVETARRPFPLLVKYIDAHEDLSIQVHPADAQAARLGERGKAECWYILDCPPGATLLLDLEPSATAERLLEAIRDGNVPDLIQRAPIQPGSFVNVPAGTVHAVRGGTLFCEVQQASDLTYRLWDWGREPRRELHVEAALAVARFGRVPGRGPHDPWVRETAELRGLVPLLAHEHFEVQLVALGGGERLEPGLRSDPHGLAASVVAGEGRWEGAAEGTDAGAEPLRRGQTWFLPAALGEVGVQAGPAGIRMLLSRTGELGRA